MKKHYCLSESEFELINFNLANRMEEFDQFWTLYEDLYVKELMIIECQSRRFITDAIFAEKKLADIEKNAKLSKNFIDDVETKSELKQASQIFTKMIAKINSVANFEGHGRDDLAVEILYAANDILLKVTACESENLRKLGQKIINSYQNLRELFRKYSENIEIVDPQLRNNPDLVEALLEYEKQWEKGKIYLMNSKRCDQLIFFTNVIEGLCEKYPTFKDSLECCDSEIFVQIPMVMLLKKVEREDNDICEVFLPAITETESGSFQMFHQIKTELLRINDKFIALKERNCNSKKGTGNSLNFTNNNQRQHCYKTLLKSNKSVLDSKTAIKKLNFEFYNYLEKQVLSEEIVKTTEKPPLNQEDQESLEKSVLNLRQLSIEMQRFNPMEWNAFLDIAISK